MSRNSKQTTRGLYGLGLIDGLTYRLSIFFLKIMGLLVFRLRVRGVENLPKEEPFLLLPNHSSLLDPFWVGTHVPRGVKAVASAHLFKIPVLGKYLSMVGCFPKKKFTKDRDAMVELQRQFDAGYVVLIFPEGNRSWDGRTARLLPGIGRLIKRLKCKVVYVRMNSAHLFQPRWARFPRWVPVEVDYDGPYDYGEDQTAEEITEHAQSCLELTPHLERPSRTWGFRMASGLASYLWACPSCLQLETLQESKRDRNEIDCTACGARWTVDTMTRLRGSEELLVSEAAERIQSHFGSPPVADQELWERERVALRSRPLQLQELAGSEKKTLGEGVLEISREGLQLRGEAGVTWRAVWSQIQAISVELGNQLHFRLDGRLIRVCLDEESPLKWDFFMRRWRVESTGAQHWERKPSQS